MRQPGAGGAGGQQPERPHWGKRIPRRAFRLGPPGSLWRTQRLGGSHAQVWHALAKALHAHSSPPRHQLMQAIWIGARRRQNPCIAKGRTIVIGTSQGLYARAHALLENVLEIRTTTECGQVFGPVRLPLDPQLLIEVRPAGSRPVLRAVLLCTKWHVCNLHGQTADWLLVPQLGGCSACCQHASKSLLFCTSSTLACFCPWTGWLQRARDG